MDNLIHPQLTTAPELIKATEIYREKASGMVAHSGLLLEFLSGHTAVFHNNPEKGPHISSLAEFSEGKPITRKGFYLNSLYIIKHRIQNILAQKRSYSVFANCEHVVSEVTKGIAKSPQLAATATGATLGAIGGYMLANNKKWALIGGLLCGLIGLQLVKSDLLQ